MELITSRASFIVCVVFVCFAKSFAQSFAQNDKPVNTFDGWFAQSFAKSFAQNDKPVNTLTERSKRTNLTCCSERGSIAWKHQQLNNDGAPDQICLDQRCDRTGYSVDNSIPGCYHLIIDSTANDAAGLYQCNEVETSSVRGAYVVVYNFTCSVDFGNSDDLVEGDIVKFHCSVSWKGKWPFEICLLNEHGKEMQNVVINDVNLNYRYTSSFEVNVYKPNFPSHTIQFAFLNNEITDPNVDKSCPSVNWTSPARNVKYGPSIIKLSCPDQNCDRRIDDTINCSADGNPSPELHWQDWDDKKIGAGSVLELKCLDRHEYTCVATNVIRGENYTTSKKITVNVLSKPGVDSSRCDEAVSNNNILIAILIVVGLILVVAIIGLIAFCLRRKKRMNQTPSTPEQTEPQPQHETPLLGKEEALEGDKNSVQPGEQNNLNDRVKHKEYNDAKSIDELGACAVVSFTSENGGSSVIHGSRYVQQVDDAESGVHPENNEGASLLGVMTDAETEDKMRKGNSTPPPSSAVTVHEVVLH